MSETYGDMIVRKLADGTVVVDAAAPKILVAKEFLDDPGLHTYVDGVLTIDTAEQYRYRRIRSHDDHADVFHRITSDEQEADS